MKKTILAGVAALALAAGVTGCKDHVGSQVDMKNMSFDDSLTYVAGTAVGYQFAQFINNPEAPREWNRDAILRGIRDVLSADTADLSYLIGLQMGMQAFQQYMQMASDVDVNKADYIAAIQNAVRLDSVPDPTLMQGELRMLMGKLQARRQAEEERKAIESEEGVKNQQAAEAFFGRVKGEEGVVAADNGVLYRVTKAGNGTQLKEGDRVEATYTVTSLDGDTIIAPNTPRTMFVSPKGSKPLSVVLPLMQAQQSATFYLPYQEAYGALGLAGRGVGPCQAVVVYVTTGALQK